MNRTRISKLSPFVSMSLALALATALPSPPARGNPARPSAARARASEPSLAELRLAALRHAGLDERPERSWARRARLAGLLPIVTLRATRARGSDQDLSRSADSERLSVGSDEGTTLEARATWRLDRLIFDDAEMHAAQATQRLHRERLDLLARVTTLYFQRRKLMLAPRGAPVANGAKTATNATGADVELAIAELTAQLDVLTGGYFSAAMQR